MLRTLCIDPNTSPYRTICSESYKCLPSSRVKVRLRTTALSFNKDYRRNLTEKLFNSPGLTSRRRLTLPLLPFWMLNPQCVHPLTICTVRKSLQPSCICYRSRLLPCMFQQFQPRTTLSRWITSSTLKTIALLSPLPTFCLWPWRFKRFNRRRLPTTLRDLIAVE